MFHGMVVCVECGNKRCPKATDCSLYCTNSNESGQVGSAYANTFDTVPVSTPLTAEMFCGARDKMMNQAVEVCGVTFPHVFNPKSVDGSWQNCANCGYPMQIPVGFEARVRGENA